MYLQTSRLQYNLGKVDVFQTAHSDKNIQAEACKILYHKNVDSSITYPYKTIETFIKIWYNNPIEK